MHTGFSSNVLVHVAVVFQVIHKRECVLGSLSGVYA